MSDAARIDELRSKFASQPKRYFAPLANEYRKAGALGEAIALCREYLPQLPGHMSGHIVFGQALYDAGQLDEAQRVFEQAVALDPENLMALRYLGDIAWSVGDAVSARRWYERVLEADPRNDAIAEHLASLGTAPRAVTTPEPLRPAQVEEMEPPAPLADGWFSAETASGGVTDAFSFPDLPNGVSAGSDEAASWLEEVHAAASLPKAHRREPEEAPPEFEEGLLAPLVDMVHQESPRTVVVSAAPPSEPVPPSADVLAAFGREPHEALLSSAPLEDEIDAIASLFQEEAHSVGEAPVIAHTAVAARAMPEPPREAEPQLSTAAVPTAPASPLETVPGQEASAVPTVPEATPVPFQTESMAELLVQQGFGPAAIAVYEALVTQRPMDAALRARLDALRAEYRVTEEPVGVVVEQVTRAETARVWWTRLGSRRVQPPATMMSRVNERGQESDVLAALFANGGPLHTEAALTTDPFAAAFERTSQGGGQATADLDEFTAWIKGAGQV